MIEVEGMEFKVLMGTDPAEVEEWRNQRRRKFPTEANLKQQERDRAALITAGGLERNSSNNGGTKQLKQKNDPKRSREGVEAGSLGNEGDQKRVKASPVTPASDPPGPSLGLSLSLVQDYGSNDSGEEQEEAKEATEDASQPRKQAAVCRAHLSGKCRRGDKCRYSHSPGEGAAVASSSQPCSYFLKGKCRRGSKCQFSHSLPAPSADGGSSTAPVAAQAPAPAMVPSLYRKLVASEVHSEENVLLQCIRFLVQENFLSQS
jgi:hypothetical protein